MDDLDKIKSYRGPSFRYKIRKLNPGNKTGDSYGINIPKVIAKMFNEVSFNIFIAGDSIILASGCKIDSSTSKNKPSVYESKVFE